MQTMFCYSQLFNNLIFKVLPKTATRSLDKQKKTFIFKLSHEKKETNCSY